MSRTRDARARYAKLVDLRTLELAQYIVNTKNTVREAALNFGLSKSTVHKDMTLRLPTLDSYLANQVREILDYNMSLRHIRGGEATRRLHKEKKDK